MPPHLHPRSAATSTLFAGTLLASFVVVGIPHVFPCPRPRKGYADSERPQLDADGKPIPVQRRRKEIVDALNPTGVADVKLASQTGNTEPLVKGRQSQNLQDEAAIFRQLQLEAEVLEKEARECPVPKPRGVIGRWLGFEQDDTKNNTTTQIVTKAKS